MYRDLFGKRSLLLQWSTEMLCLSSVLFDQDKSKSSMYFEVPSDCLLVLGTENGRIDRVVDIKRNCKCGMSPSQMRFGHKVQEFHQGKFLEELDGVMTESVMKRVRNIPEIAH